MNKFPYVEIHLNVSSTSKIIPNDLTHFFRFSHTHFQLSSPRETHFLNQLTLFTLQVLRHIILHATPKLSTLETPRIFTKYSHIPEHIKNVKIHPFKRPPYLARPILICETRILQSILSNFIP